MGHVVSILRSTLGHQFGDMVPLSPQDFCATKQGTLSPISEEQIPQIQPLEIPTRKTTLLDHPSDVLFLISDHLDTLSVHALALTCRALYGVGFPKTQRKLEADDKQELLITLERDPFGDGFYYCARCNKLHTFKQSYGPHSKQEGADKTQGYICGMRDRFTPMGNSYDLGYHHARLAMNRHFYGAEYGIPLKNICIQHQSQREKTTIQCSTSASIINDELFLRRTYTFTVTNLDAPVFRRCTGHRDFRLCEHLPFFRNSSIYHQAIPELQRQPRAVSSKDQFVPCTNSPGSCGLCLLDYDITISKVDSSDVWKVQIDAYHQLGDCRSPDDWKWARFTEKSRPHLFFTQPPQSARQQVHPRSCQEGLVTRRCP